MPRCARMIRCPGCDRDRKHFARGRCSTCYMREYMRGYKDGTRRRPSTRAPKHAGEVCRHCGRDEVARPRRLCVGCYDAPAVRDLYPAEEYTPEPLTEAEAARDAEPPETFKERQRRESRRDAGPNWDAGAGVGAGGFELHPDTSPAAIATAQRADVRAARERLGRRATVANVSAAVCLPVDIVTRHWESS